MKQLSGLNDITRHQIVAVWLGAVAVITACVVATGVQVGIGTAVVWLMAWVVPPVIVFASWHGIPAETAAEILHAENTGTGDRGSHD